MKMIINIIYILIKSKNKLARYVLFNDDKSHNIWFNF